tara:strand:+ start:482 stop:847 length:366 start_codon:yes stop_codon:yes gene_type:complete
MNEDVIVPVALFAMIGGIVWLNAYFNSKKRLVMQETLRLAIERGETLSPELIQRMSMVTNPVIADMRRAVILFAITAAIVVIGFVAPIDDSDGIRGVMAGAVIPGALAFAYLGLWRFGHDR